MAYHSTRITIDKKTSIGEGLATRLDDGAVSGHVAIYMKHGSVTISSEDVDVLRSLAAELEVAADRMIAEAYAEVPA